MTIRLPIHHVRLVQSRAAHAARLGLKKKKGPRKRAIRQDKPTRAEKLEVKLIKLQNQLPIHTISCQCKGTNELGEKINHLRDDHTCKELERLRCQYYSQGTEEKRKSFLKTLLRPEDAIEGQHVHQLQLHGHYICWDGVKKLFGVSRNLLSCIAATPHCLKYGKFCMMMLSCSLPY
jgi:hypothetical protein